MTLGDPVARYFAAAYPARGRALARWFRAGEAARRGAVAPWLAELGGASVLDAGAGDGAFLARAHDPARPLAALWLVDLAPAVLARAAVALAGRAHAIHTIAGDVRTVALPDVDVVTAFGVTDYHADWDGLIARLAGAARRAVIVDFPRAWRPRSLARWLWLGAHGVALHTATAARVRAVAGRFGPVELAATRLHWIARIDRAGRR